MYVADLVALPAQRGKGYGKALFAWLEDTARQAGCKRFAALQPNFFLLIGHGPLYCKNFNDIVPLFRSILDYQVAAGERCAAQPSAQILL